MAKVRLYPRFSVRTLAIFVTLVCCYFGAWEATKRWGMPLGPTYVVLKARDGTPRKVRLGSTNESSPMPLVIGRDEMLGYSAPTRHYYLWLFGLKFKLPFESTWK